MPDVHVKGKPTRIFFIARLGITACDCKHSLIFSRTHGLRCGFRCVLPCCSYMSGHVDSCNVSSHAWASYNCQFSNRENMGKCTDSKPQQNAARNVAVQHVQV